MKTKLLILMALFLQGCVQIPPLPATKEPPLYGPWDVKTMTNKELDVLLRNVYSDGWQSAMEVNKL